MTPLDLIFSSRLNSKISELKIVMNFSSLNLIDNFFASSLSFSIKINDLGFRLIISSVRAPLPGPISITFLFLIET